MTLQRNTNSTDINIVLGTLSKYRHSLFSQHFPNIPFTHQSPDIDEKAIFLGNGNEVDNSNIPRDKCDPEALTLAIAHAKADALLPSLIPGTVLLTLDQVVMCNGQLREKPESESECRQFLNDYSTKPLQTVGAVVVTVVAEELTESKQFEGVDIAVQQFSPIPQQVVDQLIQKGDVMYCAGGITVEDPLLAPYLGKRQGSLDSIMGLPVALVKSLLEQAGVKC